MGIMQFNTAEAQETLLGRFDGIEAECNDIEGLAEVDVIITESQLPDKIKEEKKLSWWVEHVIEWQFKDMLSAERRRVGCEARATEIYPSLIVEAHPDKTHYSVWARFY